MDGARETRQRRKPRVLFSQVHNPKPPIYDPTHDSLEISKNLRSFVNC